MRSEFPAREVPDLSAILADLAAESEHLDRLVAAMTAAEWAAPTPAAGWSVAHQIAHLAWTDEVALLAATDEQGFRQAMATTAASANPFRFVDEVAELGARQTPAELLGRWRAGRAALADALLAAEPGMRLPWFGPPMSPASMATARIMETWAHGQDVADAVSAETAAELRRTSPGLRHVAHLGVRTRDFAFRVHDLDPPTEQFRVELSGPDNEEWAWGPVDAAQRVHGPAADFCLLVTRRRHRDDCAVVADGPDAQRWLTIAQAFAGPPGAGRQAGGRQPGQVRQADQEQR